MNKYKILILSNQNNEEIKEDELIKKAFIKDGHDAIIRWIDFEEKDETFDIILRRNTWVENYKEVEKYDQLNTKLIERLKDGKVKTVNLIGLDGIGKKYLCEMFIKNYDVLPSINNINKFNLLPSSDEYVIKSNKSFGSGINQKIVKKEDVIDTYVEGDIIQPKLKFKSEVQCYFVGNKSMYVYEYSPSKYPNYPEPNLINLNKDELTKVNKIIEYTNLKYGFQRIDFLRLENNELLLLEIEDNSPNMNITKLPLKIRKKILEEYKTNIYSYLRDI